MSISPAPLLSNPTHLEGLRLTRHVAASPAGGAPALDALPASADLAAGADGYVPSADGAEVGLGEAGSTLAGAAGLVMAPHKLGRAVETTRQGIQAVRQGDLVAGSLQASAGVATGVEAVAQAANGLAALAGAESLATGLGGLLGSAEVWNLAGGGAELLTGLGGVALGMVGSVASGVADLTMGAHDVYCATQKHDLIRAHLGAARVLVGTTLVAGAMVGAPAAVAGAALTSVALDLASRLHEHNAARHAAAFQS
jgi:hypothetical protein